MRFVHAVVKKFMCVFEDAEEPKLLVFIFELPEEWGDGDAWFCFPKRIMDLNKPETSKNRQLCILHHD